MSLGFSRAGFLCLGAYDSWKPAVETYRANLGDHIKLEVLSNATCLPKASLIVGGPPCQGFSSAGARRPDDVRNSLIGVFAQLIVAYKPVAFVMENVEGFLTADGGSFLMELLNTVIPAGYRVHVRKVNAANYGVPQHRKRVFAIGGRGWTPTFPQPLFFAYGAPGSVRASNTLLPKAPTLETALRGLPSPESPDAPQGHRAQSLKESDKARAQRLEQGQTMRDLPTDLWHASFQRRAFRRVADGTPTERRGGAPAGLRRLKFSEPSKAITSAAVSEFLHPLEHRPLTVRECARIQTFPDEFVFRGGTSEQAQVVGNAVPPTLAHEIARNLLQDLHHIIPDVEQGSLLSFAPTSANGMSPILEDVVTRVEKQFGTPRMIGGRVQVQEEFTCL